MTNPHIVWENIERIDEREVSSNLIHGQWRGHLRKVHFLKQLSCRCIIFLKPSMAFLRFLKSLVEKHTWLLIFKFYLICQLLILQEAVPKVGFNNAQMQFSNFYHSNREFRKGWIKLIKGLHMCRRVEALILSKKVDFESSILLRVLPKCNTHMMIRIVHH